MAVSQTWPESTSSEVGPDRQSSAVHRYGLTAPKRGPYRSTIDAAAGAAHLMDMGDVGKPERIVEDEPISFPDAEPFTIPAPAPSIPTPEPEPVPVPVPG
ncbi:hypothetical protein [Frankia sp. AgKG'84/4]|uniref:hypothetical protein n=1 Tax=Frankia sp. AgKG'84/4 TaxID=573490 RepID=UPI00202A727A|nr:hypothetical protein [Frankia sp. AgKG'84/4]MCL9797301.1 hypothetical protein [Frankia sp. AgKG'84/4]